MGKIGSLPYNKKKGLNLVVSLVLQRYDDKTQGSQQSQSLWSGFMCLLNESFKNLCHLSVLPLVCGWYGVVRILWILRFALSRSIVSLQNSVPLSDRIMKGQECCGMNCDNSSCAIVRADLSDTAYASGQPVK